jgi:hypothetical protein
MCGAGGRIVQPASKPLRARDLELIVDPPMAGIELVRILVVGRNMNVGWTANIREVLQTPWVALVDWHCPREPAYAA